MSVDPRRVTSLLNRFFINEIKHLFSFAAIASGATCLGKTKIDGPLLQAGMTAWVFGPPVYQFKLKF